MTCPVCESFQLIEDENTGQLICAECGIATGLFQGVTQSQDFSETRGLRVVYKSNPSVKSSGNVLNSNLLYASSQPTQNEPQSQKSTDLFLEESQLNTVISMAVDCAVKNEAPLPPIHPRISSRSYKPDILDYISSDEEFNFGKKKSRKKNSNRPWRLSEPFTFIMKIQTDAIIKELKIDSDQQFRDTIWAIWLQYLGITGELGEQAWLEAAMKPVMAIRKLSQKQEQCLSKECLTVNLRHKKLKSIPIQSDSHLLLSEKQWMLISNHLKQFSWVGWGTLYEPDEGREIMDHLNLPPEKIKIAADHTKRVKKLAPTNRGRKRKAPSSSSDESELSDDTVEDKDKFEHELNEEEIKMNPEQTSSQFEPSSIDQEQKENDNLFTISSDESDSIREDHSTNEKSGNDAFNFFKPKRSKRPSFYTDKTIRRSLAKKLYHDQSSARIFWRGQTEIGLNYRGLLEHNLAILFIACFGLSPSRKSLNTLAWINTSINNHNCDYPIALTTMITLRDLQELCATHRLPFIAIENHFPSDAFAVHDQCLRSLFYRNRPPELNHLTYATVRMFDFIGLNQIPKFPLGWLIHRHLIALGLPSFLHNFVILLLKRLQKRSTILSRRVNSDLTSLIPWHRLVRPEVFAMGLVVILLRLIFKINGVHEFRLSRIARTLENFSNRPIANGQIENRNSIFDRPFIWTSWMNYAEDRFRPKHKLSSALQDPVALVNSRSKIRDKTEPLITNATCGLELMNLEKASDFLGSSEFQFGISIGWGETNWKPLPVADVTAKLSMSQPLREVFLVPDVSQNESEIYDSFTNVDETQISCHNGLIHLKIEQKGYQSPFRNTQLNFIYNQTVQTECLLSLSENVFTSNAESNSISSPKEEYELITTWWLDLIDRRSDYCSICTGEWATLSKNKSKLKNRARNNEPIQLPKPVTDLITSHNVNLIKALNNSKSISEKETLYHTPLTNESHTLNEEESGLPCMHCQKPSETLKWLIEICSIVCGVPSIQTLLIEIDCVERLLKWCAPATCSELLLEDKVKSVDLAVLSCFDLNHELCDEPDINFPSESDV